MATYHKYVESTALRENVLRDYIPYQQWDIVDYSQFPTVSEENVLKENMSTMSEENILKESLSTMSEDKILWQYTKGVLQNCMPQRMS